MFGSIERCRFKDKVDRYKYLYPYLGVREEKYMERYQCISFDISRLSMGGSRGFQQYATPF